MFSPSAGFIFFGRSQEDLEDDDGVDEDCDDDAVVIDDSSNYVSGS